MQQKKHLVSILLILGLIVLGNNPNMQISLENLVLDYDSIPFSAETHSAISITSDAEMNAFCAGNVTDGQSWATAYVIENLTIEVDGSTIFNAIELANIGLYVVLRNISLTDTSGGQGNGIKITSSSNINITNCSIQGFWLGVNCLSDSHLYFSNNSIHSSGSAISFSNTETSIMMNNTLTGDMHSGIRMEFADGNSVTNNNISDCGTGVYLFWSNGNLIDSNRIFQNSNGIESTWSQNTIFRDNTMNNPSGFSLIHSNNLIIHGNIQSYGNFYLSSCQNLSLDTTNTITALPVYYYENTTGLNLDNLVLSLLILNNVNASSISQLDFEDVNYAIMIDLCDGITLDQISISNATAMGISITQSSNILVKFSDFSENSGCYGYNSTSLKFQNSTFSNLLKAAIYLSECNLSRIEDCAFNLQDTIGIELIRCLSSTLDGNQISTTNDGIAIQECFLNSISTNNFINSKIFYYFESQNNVTFCNLSNAAAVFLVNINESSIIYNNLTFGRIYLEGGNFNNLSYNVIGNASVGITLYDSYNNTVWRNIVQNCSKGLYVYGSTGNNISENLIQNNTGNSGNTGIYLFYSFHNSLQRNIVEGWAQYGLYISFSSYNNLTFNQFQFNNITILISYSSGSIIHHNNFIGCIQYHLMDYGFDTVLDDGDAGNYWDDYSVKYPSALNNSLIWDTNYTCSPNTNDTRPLVNSVGIGGWTWVPCACPPEELNNGDGNDGDETNGDGDGGNDDEPTNGFDWRWIIYIGVALGLMVPVSIRKKRKLKMSDEDSTSND